METFKSKRHRIKFFSVEDMAVPYELKKAEDLLNNYDKNSSYDINDLFEYYNIKLHFENNLFFKSWSEETKKDFIEKTEYVFSILKEKILSIDDSNLELVLSEIEIKYYTDFWTLINQFNVYKKFNGESFLEMLKKDERQIRHILKHKGLVDKLDKKIKEFLLQYKNTAELLLSGSEEKHTPDKSLNYFFPKSLSSVDIEQIINSYLESNKPNLNYVRLIESSKDTDIKLSPKTRLKAKKKSEELNNQILENGHTWNIGVQIGISQIQDEPIKRVYSNGLHEIIYSEKFLNSCLNNDVELFHLFSQLFTYSDKSNLITLVSKESEMNTFEKMLMQSKNAYGQSEVFLKKENRSDIQLILFDDYLKRNNSSIEKIINSFVEYINNLIQPVSLIFKIPINYSSHIEVIRNIAPEYEFLLKQYKLLVEDGIIDLELIQIDSNPVRFSALNSFNDKKYIYPNGNQILNLAHIFFSNQSFLYYIERYEDKYDSLFDLLINENVKIDDFEDYQKNEITWLINENYLKINQQGYIKFQNETVILILQEIYGNEVINYWNYSKIVRDEIDYLIDKKLLKCENTLLSNQEKNYFNFYLNKKEFTNGHDLRNKYLHGTNSFSEEVHKRDYYRLLKIIILTLLKIEDDVLIRNRNI